MPLNNPIGLDPGLLPSAGFQTNRFYVDATHGSDSNSGRTSSDPWQTIGKINGETFLSNDSVLFKRGETWTGTALIVPQSNLSFGAYGVGAKPIIDGNDLVNCIDCSNRHGIVFQNIHVTQALNFGFYIHAASSYVSLLDCEASDCGNDNVIFVLDVAHCTVRNLVSYDAYERVGGVRITCLEITDGSHDIEIYNSEFYGSESAGISIHSHATTELPYNITIDNCDIHDNDDIGIVIAQDNAGAVILPDAEINITNCTMTDNAGPGSGANIYITATGDPYPAGIEFIDCTSITATERALYVGGTAKFLRCVFDGEEQSRIDGAEDVVIHNCAFYRLANLAFDIVGTTDGVIMRNCIIVTGGNVPIVVTTTTNVDIDYMIYDAAISIESNAVMFWGVGNYTWANWLINSGQDANSPTPADPLFVDLANDDFTLQSGSPAIDKGVDLGYSYLGSAPDLGYAEKA